MNLRPEQLEEISRLIFMKSPEINRYTQDSPVYPDVWLYYFKNADKLKTFRLDLILTPHNESSAATLFKLLKAEKDKTYKTVKDQWELASSGESVVAKLTFYEMIRAVLPLTKWWQKYLWDAQKQPTPDQQWFIQLVGAVLYESVTGTRKNSSRKKLSEKEQRNAYAALVKKTFGNLAVPENPNAEIALWSVSRNRPAGMAVEKSVPVTKADASRRVFGIDGSGIAWAILDTGIDARHIAFRKKQTGKSEYCAAPFLDIGKNTQNLTRVVATYDFTRFREVIASIHENKGSVRRKSIGNATGNEMGYSLSENEITDYVTEIEQDLRSGRILDWTVVAPLLRIPHNDRDYRAPIHPHGTHVAGILAAGMAEGQRDSLVGMCPGIELYDIRVLDGSGNGQEFNILAAIQFLRWMNSQREGLIIQGANMSLSMTHEVASYACGQTPVCASAEKMVSDGMVVVAASGNLGQTLYQTTHTSPLEQGFRMVNITDPGNAEDVITVGATHRSRPHSYGVSYFSSKGPTGDGRVKPDIVAPGEKIVSAGLRDLTERMDGTSMAAPHVSGAAALLLAKNRELIGKPRKIKQILCSTATDLGREKYFQGCGLVDVLRAIQSV